MARRYYSSTAARTTLASGVNDSTTTFTVAAVSGWPSSFPYTLIIDQDTINEEIVEVTARSGTTLTVTRGVDGTTGVAHDAGAAVNHGVSARDFDEPNAFINGTDFVSTDGGSTVTASGASVVPLVLKGASGQTANLLTVEDSAGTDLVSVKSTGRIGIGTDSPSVPLQIFDAGSSSTTPSNNDAQIILQDSGNGAGNGGMLLLAASQGGFAAIKGRLTNGDSNTVGDLVMLTRNAVADTTLTERMRITSTGATLIGTTTAGSAGAGDLVVNGGVFLGGTAAANELDDYEEGTWTPTFTNFTVGNGTVGTCTYTKVGRIVTVTFAFTFGSTTAFPGGTASISSLPFVATRPHMITPYVIDDGNTFYTLNSRINGSVISLYSFAANGAIALVNATTPFTWASGDQIQFNFAYETS